MHIEIHKPASEEFYYKFISDPEQSGPGIMFPDPDPATIFDPTRSGSTTLIVY
jgi:hypothetical protein